MRCETICRILWLISVFLPKSLILFSIDSRPPYQFKDGERYGWTSENTVYHPSHVMIVRWSSEKNCCWFRSLTPDHLACFDDGQLFVDKWWRGSNPSFLWLRINFPLHVHIDPVKHNRKAPLFSVLSSSTVFHTPVCGNGRRKHETFLSVHYDFVSSNNAYDNTTQLKIKTVFE